METQFPMNQKKDFDFSKSFSCGRRDLNPYAKTMHKILSLARLPIPTLPLGQLSPTKNIILQISAKVNNIFIFFYLFLKFLFVYMRKSFLLPFLQAS